jgi:hypothetical protein
MLQIVLVAVGPFHQFRHVAVRELAEVASAMEESSRVMQ